MVRICSWCNKVIGEKMPLEDKSITHGICPKCLEEHAKKIELGYSVNAYRSMVK